MKKVPKLICESVLLIWVGIAFLPISSGARVWIERGLFLDAEMLFISDFDFQDLQNNPKLFEILIKTDDPKGTTVWVEFSVSTGIYGQLLWAKTDTFVLENERYITNFDFDRAGSPNNPDIKLGDYNWDLERATTLQEVILATGRAPADNYSLRFRVEEYNNPDNYDIFSKTITITNPTAVNLITPGGDPANEEIIFTTYPRFQWESLADSFQLTICEKLPEDMSPEEVMNKLPHYQTIIENQTFHEYPTSGARALESGHTYYWQVEAIIPTLRGDIHIASDIWGFTIWGISELNQLLSELEELLGEGYGGIFDILQNYRPTGKIIMDGRTISMDELRSYLQGFRTGKYKITNVNVE